MGYFKSLAAQAEAETSPDQLSLFAASLAHITYGQVLMICSTEEDHVAAHVLAEIELRMAVEQNPRSVRANTDLGTCLMRVQKNADAIVYFKLALVIRPNYSVAIESLKYVEEQVDKHSISE